MENIFQKRREKMGYSIEKISKETGISRYILKKVEKNQFSDLKLEDFIKLCKFLRINPFQFIRKQYSLEDDVFGENLFYIIHYTAKSLLMDIVSNLRQFAKLTQYRYDSFDLLSFIESDGMRYKLISLNRKLQNKEISIQEALEEIPPIKHYERRRN